MNLILAIQFLTFVFNLILGFFVLYKNPKSYAHWFFWMFAFGVAGWNLSLFMIISEAGLTTMWGWLAFSLAAFMPTGLVLFAAAFPRPDKKFMLETILVLSLGIFFVISPAIIPVSKNVHSVNRAYIAAEFAPFSLIYMVHHFGFFIWAFSKLISKYKKSQGTQRAQLKYIIAGSLSFFIPLIIFNIILPNAFGVFKYNNLGPLFTLPMVGLISYAILRHQLMDIKIVIERGLIYSLLTALTASFYLAAAQAISSFFSAPADIAALLSAGLALLVGLAGIPVIERWFHALELEKKVAERTAQIAELQEEQKQMMIDISHGLQTPLTVIKSEIGSLKKTSGRPDKLRVLEKSIDDVSKFIYDLLNLAKLESGVESFQKESVDLSELVKELAEYFGVLGRDKGISVSHGIQPNISIFGDKEKLRELVTNLASNAFKYMAPDREKKILINLSRINNCTNLIIEDTGVGIDEEHIPKIFQRFYRVGAAASNTNTKGAGLGLAIAKKIAECHGGEIKVESQLGKGTKFTVTFL